LPLVSASLDLTQVIDSLTDSKRRAEELADNFRSTVFKVEASRRDEPEANREAEDYGNSNTQPYRAAQDRKREFQQLSERIRSSDRKNRKNRKSVGESFRELTAQFGEKIQQFASSIFGESEDIEQRQVQGTELDRGGNDNQAPRITQGDLGYPTRDESNHLGTQPNISSQQQPASRDQRPGQQQRNSSKSNREEAKRVEIASPKHPQAHPQPTPPLLPDSEEGCF
jgi:hypothetical protein